MRTVVLGPRPEALQALIDHRRSIGADLYDEVWDGEYHMAPAPNERHGRLTWQIARALEARALAAGLTPTAAFNLGHGSENFRVPDWGFLREVGHRNWVPTAVIVVEILSPDDETFEKFDFYAAHGVQEIIVVDGDTQRVRIFERASATTAAFVETGTSRLLDVTGTRLEADLDWS